jgi:hypothetical protein
MYWTKKLSYTITPKSGPVRRLDSLLDANHALSKDLPRGYLHRAHWLAAGNSILQAAESGAAKDIAAATEELLRALEQEGWMTRAPWPQKPTE